MSRWRPRPGASEVYEILVPCALAEGGRHKIKLRLRLADNRVTFEGVCDRRAAEAHDALLPETRVHVTDYACQPWIALMHNSIKFRAVQAFDLARCRTCDAIVPSWHNDCPFQIFDEDAGPTHHLDRRANLAFWERIVRSGCIR